MPKPIVHKTTQKTLDAITSNLPQSLLISGTGRVGLTTIAKHIAEAFSVKPLLVLPEKDEKIDLEKGVIGVETMRDLSCETTTKTSGKRIIIIDYAETMTIQAQNAFLKLLEEPGEGLHFILVSNTASKLLPTITSRTEHLKVKPITPDQSNKLLDDLGVNDTQKRSQILFMANGLPAEITKLATDEKYFSKQADIVMDARELLRAPAYQKLLVAQKYKDDRAATLRLLNDAAKIIEKTIIANPSKETLKLSEKLIKAQERIEANGNIRLCLSQLIM